MAPDGQSNGETAPARLAPDRLRRRIAIEAEHEATANPIERWYSFRAMVRNSLRLAGLYQRGMRNADQVVVRENIVTLPRLPREFDGFTLLHLSDLHIDRSLGAAARVAALVAGLDYDHCVMTGDYRGRTFGDAQEALDAMTTLRAALKGPVHGVLGNHDPIGIVPALETMGIAILMNESIVLTRGEARLHLAGIDDPHFFGTHDIAVARAAIPDGDCAILLSHTPETCREAEAAGFDFMLSGHTHGGQVCLPGGIALTFDGVPRKYGAGAWRHGSLVGYTSRGIGTSVAPVRFNCPPEIVLHRLRCG